MKTYSCLRTRGNFSCRPTSSDMASPAFSTRSLCSTHPPRSPSTSLSMARSSAQPSKSTSRPRDCPPKPPSRYNTFAPCCRPHTRPRSSMTTGLPRSMSSRPPRPPAAGLATT
ncbi:microtubule-associated protein ytm1 [Verticillium dahliae VdLs.17]|uniref:Microtubule-associated protein ytm1 n=1 Tax=Verticillium dahliae (strain VdLs.17 / ATCC MYA-4575 / FGSC 10137) TaxID=498257 RepID=G2XE51_VERDV|nr:microtubule-associated protein ytm1 [Verticillium dahliae VdLs.17]EGY18099.1 microtubule-associated protein ytm1 [Verticillium dahliae VdLs.17]